MSMNGNLSQQQMGNAPVSMAKFGAMPIKTRFDGPAPIKEQSQRGVMQPNVNLRLPKPGFF